MYYTYKQIWLINFPVMMSILMEQLINITDAVFLGHVGEVELGASAIAGIYYLAVYMLGFGFSIGLQVMIARRNGEQNYKETGKTFFQGLFFLSGLAILLCFHLCMKINKEKYGLKPTFDGKLLAKVLNLSVWSMMHAFISVFPWFLFFVMIEHLGKNELAISNITRSVSTVFFVIVNSFAVTTGSLVSNAIGAGSGNELFSICRRVLKLGYAIGIPLVGIALYCNRWIVGLYTNSDLLIQLASAPFVVMLLNYGFALPGCVYLNAVGGTGKTSVTFLFQVITTVVYLAYLYWLALYTQASLAIYLTAEYLFVILLAHQSIIYLKSQNY